ncbi:RNA polymerase sigma factor [Leptospira borgpetersenii serovar Hardjo-bovis]|uniref:Sigma-70 region 2 n=1 Tax=Leptospira borgpetersenii serovar Hardjo-bovis str. Sponselee TaxID=1303729 RepID=M6BZS5_LEPBO|nr:RNA polymerase sigma factor [Leptospira borgpetersenii]ABJ80313.1 RNA polymerase sigma subunit [Leptospira borgpetersenii serovar Hardjo-bovis str. L550]AMX59788.1 DNA-directed RNA polymerase sigma-70 factor [Leptospira borgpetersenii serovar Hardjo]AMX63016.1 DNA-directed RNA polymerase sigma-70 factor [Leptospira borgpetersenii serovar Hardjo]AMX66259.1 DNA-directed RNA polymerase sigma-70 factor [Leptospira borgpetersenii serovar Hardjo]AMX69491.1 DNA-directed RNA polymerase sigma-70 fac
MVILNDQPQEKIKPDWPDLIRRSFAGNREVLDQLLASLQPFVFNLAQKMLLNPDDAADATQEILLKVVLGLQTYDANKAKFTTWAYAIARNQLLKFRTGKIEALTGSFDQFAEEIHAVADEVIEARELQNPETQLLVKEANVGCMLGILLCLTREQRMVFILGEFFSLKSDVAGEICGVSSENYRQQLSRARKDLYSFMHNKCGLVNKANPCRCHRKTRGFIKAGYVDPQNIRFAAHHYKNARIFSEEHADAMCDLDDEYGQLFRRLPAYDAGRALLTVQNLLNNEQFKDTFKV